MSDDIKELSEADFARAIPRRQRERIIRGELAGGEDIVALRRFTGLTQQAFANALGISVHTLRNWEQGRRSPDGPARHVPFALVIRFLAGSLLGAALTDHVCRQAGEGARRARGGQDIVAPAFHAFSVAVRR